MYRCSKVLIYEATVGEMKLAEARLSTNKAENIYYVAPRRGRAVMAIAGLKA